MLKSADEEFARECPGDTKMNSPTAVKTAETILILITLCDIMRM